MCSRSECQRYIGQYVRFRSPYGYHEGVIERVSGNQAIVLSPRRYIPVHLASTDLRTSDEQKLDVALAWGGYGGGYGRGYGGGYPGYGYGYGYAWGRWAVSFLAIYLLFGLLW